MSRAKRQFLTICIIFEAEAGYMLSMLNVHETNAIAKDTHMPGFYGPGRLGSLSPEGAGAQGSSGWGFGLGGPGGNTGYQ